jgi:hypothetical protein
MRPGSILDIQLSGGHGEPLAIPHVIVEVMFLQGGRERYRFDAGETDVGGHLSVSYDRFENIRKDNQSFALMDYNTRLEECDPILVVRVPTMAELSQRLDALNKWFPDQAPAMAERIKSANNGRVEVPEVRAHTVEGGRARVDLPGRAAGL